MAQNRRKYELLFELSADASQLKRDFKSAGGVTGALNGALSALRHEMKDVSAYQRQQSALATTQKLAGVLQVEYDRLKDELAATAEPAERLQHKFNKVSTELERTNKRLERQRTALGALGEDLGRVGIDTAQLAQENKSLQDSYDDLNASARTLSTLEAAQERNRKAVQETKQELMTTLGVYTAIAAAGYQTVLKPAAAFEGQMSTVAALSGASPAELAELSALAQEQGASTQFTATESGKGLEYMAQAGWNTRQMIGGLPGITQLAAAADEDLAEVADIVTDALTAFGCAAEDSGKFSDVLAQAAASSNTDVGKMGETFKQVAPLAGALGYSVEDMAVAIGLMANRGIKGERAGTSLKNVIANMADPTEEAAAALAELNTSLTDGAGKAAPFEAVMHALRDGMAGITEAEKIRLASSIAGKEGMAGLLAIVNSGNEEFDALYGKVEHCAGAAQKMAEIRLDNLNGDVTLLASAWEGTAITVSQSFLPALRDGVQTLTAYLNDARTWAESNGALLVQLVQLAGGLAALKLGFSAAKLGVLWLGGGVLKAAKGVTKLSAAFKLLSAGQGIGVAIKSMGGATAALTTFAPVAAAVALAAVALGAGLKKAWEDAKTAELDRRFGEITLSAEQLDQAAAALVDHRHLEQAVAALTAFGQLDGIAGDLESARKELEQMNWLAEIGVTLTLDQQENYRQDVARYVAGVQDYITGHGYAVSLGIQTLLGDGTAADGIAASVSAVTLALQGRVAALGTELSASLAAAFEDGMFDFNEAQAAAKLQQKLSEVQRIITESDYAAKLDLLGAEAGGDLTAQAFRDLMGKMNDLAKEHAQALQETTEATLAGLHTNVGLAQWTYDDAPSADNRKLLDDAKAALADFRAELGAGGQAVQGYVDAATFGLGQIMERYPEFDSIVSDFNANATEAYAGLSKQGGASQEALLEAVWASTEGQRDAYSDMDATTKSTMSDCMGFIGENIDAVQEQIEKYQDAGEAIPENIAKIMRAYRAWEIMQSGARLPVALAERVGYSTSRAPMSDYVGTFQYNRQLPIPDISVSSSRAIHNGSAPELRDSAPTGDGYTIKIQNAPTIYAGDSPDALDEKLRRNGEAIGEAVYDRLQRMDKDKRWRRYD